MAVALPIESNPEIMTRYLQKLGVPDGWRIVDVVSLEEEHLQWVPRPVLALILLFPLSEAYEKQRSEEEKALQSSSQEPPREVFHLKQALSNVCGTIALVHGVANNTQHINLNDGLLKSFLSAAEGLDAAGKGALLENSKPILDAYNELVNTDAEEEQEIVKNHFVTFIHKGDSLFELDGRKSAPINHGATTTETFFEDAVKVCRSFINREPNNINFNIVALVPSQ